MILIFTSCVRIKPPSTPCIVIVYNPVSVISGTVTLNSDPEEYREDVKEIGTKLYTVPAGSEGETD